ncbi:MAG: hypothetical protein WBP43_17345 [Chitinophagales bacterium]
MKNIFFLIILCACTSMLSAQFVDKMVVDEEISGICDKNEVYALFESFKGQDEAKSQFTEDQIEQKLNTDVAFLKENVKYKDEGMIRLIINCNGEVVQCEMDNKTKSEILDEQIVAIFKALGPWTAGELDGKAVDSVLLFSFEIKKGVLELN